MRRSPFATFDSASAMVRALGEFLHGRDFPGLGTRTVMSPLTSLAAALPEGARRAIYALGGWGEGVPERRMAGLRAQDFTQWVTGRYPARRYPAIMIGAGNGAVVHLAAALGVPWLPQTFLVLVRRRGHPDDPRRDFRWAREPAAAALAGNPDVQLHHMHDPNQDRLMLRHVTYFRFKLRRLTTAYVRMIEDRLEPGGTIIIVDCRNRWPVTRVNERHYFQPGAVGGATVDEYLRGGRRVEALLARERSPARRWDYPEPDAIAPEAEWGFEDALRQDVEAIARRRGLTVRHLTFEDPDEPSPAVAELYRWWYERLGLPTGRLHVGSFILIEPYWTLRTASIPYWATFSVEPSAASLERYLDAARRYDEILLTAFCHGVRSVGVAGPDRWRRVMERAPRRRFLGLDPRRFPTDFSVFVRHHQALKALGARAPLPAPLTLADLDAFAASPAGSRWKALLPAVVPGTTVRT